MRSIDIYVGERYYGSIRVKWPPRPFTMSEEELHDEVVRRLPTLRNTKFTIAI